MIFEKFNSGKHKKLLEDYLKNLEKEFEYIPFVFSINFIEVLSQFKKIFLVIENREIINLGYENKIKNHFGFFFEAPKQHYDFLKDARTIDIIWIPKERKKIIIEFSCFN